MPDARNFNEVVNTLANNNFRGWSAVVSFMKRTFPEIEHINVPQDEAQPGSPMGEVSVLYTHRDDPIPLRNCGTGVQQLLRLAAEVAVPRMPHVFLIDEPQAYLHPHAERELLRLIDEFPDHQYVIATHSHVLLNSRPLHQSRLVTITGGRTRVSTPDERQNVLAEIGITPADLGLAERIIWVEGPSEVAAFDVIATRGLEASAVAGTVVRQMPVAPSQFARAGQKAEVAYRLCEQISQAVAPFDVEMTFLFDSDEKPEEKKEAIREVSGGRARFLERRELENYFLRTDVLVPFITELARAADDGLEFQVADVETEFGRLVADTDNSDLFKEGLDRTLPPLSVVSGAAVIDALAWKFATTRYDKGLHAHRLAELALDEAPDALAELVAVFLPELATDTVAATQAAASSRLSAAKH